MFHPTFYKCLQPNPFLNLIMVFLKYTSFIIKMSSALNTDKTKKTFKIKSTAELSHKKKKKKKK